MEGNLIMGNRTSFKPGNRLAPRMVRGPNDKFAAKAPTPRLVWTDVDAPEAAARLHDGSGMVQFDAVRVPTAHRPLPPNLLDADPALPLVAKCPGADWLLFGALMLVLAECALALASN
ncbi:MAG: hypothetical protein V4564_07585 [Pseudomonadota bacterium]